MEKPFHYKLVPDSFEAKYRSSREEIERKQLLRIFSMAVVLIAVFLTLEIPNLTQLPGYYAGIAARLLALVTSIAGIWKLRRSYRSAKDETFVFVCGLVVILHILTNNVTQNNDPISIAAWDIAAIFAIYSLVPIGIKFQATLALILTAGSQTIWIMVTAPQLGTVEAFATPLAYVAANCFGITLSLTLNRIQRQEFRSLANERDLRRDLEQTMGTLKDTMETRDQLFSMLAHDLRGPIGALSSIGKLLETAKSKTDSERDELINLLCIGSKTSYELLDNLLNWSLSETGSIEPEITTVDLQTAIQANLDLLAASANNKNIRLLNESSQRHVILADRNMLDTVLRNLIANAIKFTRDNGEISISHRPGQNETIEIEIKDNGIGIEQSRLERIFNLGFDETSQGTKGESGSNLGLRICHDFTAKQAGRISVQSKPGIGTRFTLSFPKAPKP